MKPIRLSIAGLHSFRERQEIDFAALTETGMFGIFGPTGSGKSTILDAITLALYGDVGRAGRNTQAILNHAEKRLEVSFEFAIGAGNKRRRYRVERAYKRGQGFSVEHQASRLLQLEEIAESDEDGLVVVAEGKNPVTQAIRSILGLEQSDFTRAVVLPQGKFAEFLQLTGSERNAMTERLFGLEQYGKALFDKVNARAKQVEADYQVVVANQAGLGDASQAALDAAQAAVQKASAELQQAEHARVEANARLKVADEVRRLMTEREAAIKAREELAQAENEMAVIRKALARSAEASRVWPLVEAWQADCAAAEQAHQRLAAQLSLAEEAQAALSEASLRRQREQARRDALEPELLAKKGRIRDAEDIEAEWLTLKAELAAVKTASDAAISAHAEALSEQSVAVQAVERLAADRTQAEASREQHTVAPETRQQLMQLREAFVGWKDRQANVRHAREAYTARQAELQSAIANLTSVAAADEQLQVEAQQLRDAAEALRERAPIYTAEDLSVARTWLGQTQSRLATAKAVEQELADLQNRHQAAYRDYENQLGELTAQRETAEQLAQVYRDLEEARQRSLSSSETALIRQLAARLKAGEACPVCGALHHPSPAVGQSTEETDVVEWTADDDAALHRADAAWRQADAAARAAETACVQRQTTVQMLREEVDRKQAQWASVWEALRQCWPPSDVLFKFKAVSQPADTESWAQFLVDLDAALAQAADALAVWDDEHRRLAERQQEVDQRRLQLGQQLAVAEAAQKAAEKEELREQAVLAEAVAACERAKDVLEKRMAVLSIEPLVDDDIAKTEAIVAARLRQLDEDDRAAAEAQRIIARLTVQLEEAQARLQQAQADVQQRELAVREHSLRMEQLEEAVAAREAQLAQYTGGASVAEAKRQLEATLADLQAASERASAEFEAATERAQAAKQAVTRAEAEFESQSKAAETAQDKLQAALAQSAFATIEAVADARLEETEAQAIADKVLAYDEAVRESTSRLADLEARLNGRSLDEEAWRNAQADAEGAEAAYKTALQTHGSRLERLQDIARRQQRWQELEEQRVALEGMATRLSALQSTLRGNGFVQYVARDQMEHVARQASERLGALTRGRYALTLTEDGSFLMRDQHNGGVLRPVSTLSGGETFLTSLSLALALSAHIQLRGQHPLEFFFLDEGFGTLDPDLLDVVISSLEKLHLERMSIGLISHVPELRQRMHRRLVVEPALPAGRGTKVILEKA
ncbi:hypothetical protein AAC03nite_10700 [Alicyclobacillus acidoterrestris]|nr:hypothetical protein AAC03nite_10700 [Alicyclobacillus acidoterrestris]